MLTITNTFDLKAVYDFQLGFQTPYFFSVSFEEWKKSFENDTDGEGRVLFKELCVKAVFDENELVGFIQYGKTAFGFDQSGEISDKVSYPVIRNLYFKENTSDAGVMLLNEAVKDLGNNERIYAFFHYFGMTCFARHGKLFEKHPHIEALLIENNFVLEHENVYYSSLLTGIEESEAEIKANSLSEGNHQYIEFKLEGTQVGGCEVHYLDESTAYLRWIYVNGDIVGKGIGTKCMKALKSFLYSKGIKRFDTDTALNNLVAQHYYEKTGFNREGITKSYFTK